MKKFFTNVFIIVIALVIFVCINLVVYHFSKTYKASQEMVKYQKVLEENRKIVEEIKVILDKNYLFDRKQVEMFEPAPEVFVRGVVRDPYTYWVDKKNAKKLKDNFENKIINIGIDLEKKDGKTIVKSVMSKSSAKKIGIKKGYEILEIGDETDISQMKKKLNGVNRTFVSVTFIDSESDIKTLSLEYRKIRKKLFGGR